MDLPRLAGVVQKQPQINPSAALCVVLGGHHGHFVSVQGILQEKLLHFVSYLGIKGQTEPDVLIFQKP